MKYSIEIATDAPHPFEWYIYHVSRLPDTKGIFKIMGAAKIIIIEGTRSSTESLKQFGSELHVEPY